MSNDKPKSKGGRPLGSTSNLSSRQRKLKSLLLQAYEPFVSEAIEVCLEVMRNPEEKGQTRIAAAKHITDRAYELVNEILTPEKSDGTSEDSDEKAEVVEMKPRLSLTVAPKKD